MGNTHTTGHSREVIAHLALFPGGRVGVAAKVEEPGHIEKIEEPGHIKTDGVNEDEPLLSFQAETELAAARSPSPVENAAHTRSHRAFYRAVAAVGAAVVVGVGTAYFLVYRAPAPAASLPLVPTGMATIPSSPEGAVASSDGVVL